MRKVLCLKEREREREKEEKALMQAIMRSFELPAKGVTFTLYDVAFILLPIALNSLFRDPPSAKSSLRCTRHVRHIFVRPSAAAAARNKPKRQETALSAATRQA